MRAFLVTVVSGLALGASASSAGEVAPADVVILNGSTRSPGGRE